MHFQFIFKPTLHISPVNTHYLGNQSQIIIIYNHSFQINGEGIRDYKTLYNWRGNKTSQELINTIHELVIKNHS